ncbi:MAG: undecaprenyldiphospho-muramoylpentapeptide beta-N-acetylglucosaminyltransferase [Burkholderiaceae bacterium]|nr:MAG: undecaprenyldiphospho-muramoylpentapeptide beta-N-acetylglucosaminyltransferase [Burkholderiaceae bacterium]
MSKTALIMAGGTGGHVFPGLAVAEVLRTRGWNIVWLGNPGGMETTLVPQHGIPVQLVRFGGVRGKGVLTKLLLPLNLLRAFWQSVRAVLRVQPNVVLGMGGYIAFPGGMMAALLGKPLVVHEQNSIAGLTNRVLARVADRTLEAFPLSLPDGTLTGNPVRKEIRQVAPPAERFIGRSGPLRLLVVGGSLGAQALNATVPQALALIPPAQRPLVTHQAGEKHLATLQQSYREAGVSGDLVAFIDNMASEYAQADLVICRAGAMTVAELAAAGVASMLVPFPYAVDDHQTTNAKFLSEAGAALLIPQKQLNASSLAEVLQNTTREELLEMAIKARALGKPEAAETVADICEAVAK